MLRNSDYGEDPGKPLGGLLLEVRRHDEGDREEELNIYRSGSAPPTVKGSLSAVGELFEEGTRGLRFDNAGGGGRGLVTDEELRSDPAYISYYYSNVNLNPRLPPPLLSREEVRFAKRYHGGSVFGEKCDRGKANNGAEENEFESRNAAEWGGHGLVGLSGLGLGNRQKSLAEIIQVDFSQENTFSQNPSQPAGCNAFDNKFETSETHFSQLHHKLASEDAFHSGAVISSASSSGSLAAQVYAPTLGASLSRSATPDPKAVARAPSPCNLFVGAGTSCFNEKSDNNPNSFTGNLSGMSESADVVAALSGMALSKDCQNVLNLQIDQTHVKHDSLLNKAGSENFNINLGSQPRKASYTNVGNGKSAGMDLNNSALMGNGQVSSFSFMKGSSVAALSNGGIVSPHYQNMDNVNPSFSNYGLSGYALNPTSPSMTGNQLGNGNLPPLFENVAAASAMGVSAVESMALGRNFASEPNFMAAAAYLQNLSISGNHPIGGAFHAPLLDPSYLQYLRSIEYASSQAGAFNDLAMDGDCVASMHTDLLQKAYMRASTPPLKAHYSAPFLGNSSRFNDSYYVNPSLMFGMLYPGSLLAGPYLPNSAMGFVSPVRHGELNLRFSSGTRSVSGAVMGGGNCNELFATSLLDEFKSNKTRRFELPEIAGHVLAFSSDQYGSRFIQQKLETATAEDSDTVFHEITPHSLSLMTDVFGNYVIQKFFEHGTASQVRELADQLTGHVLTLSLQMYGCRVIQKAIEVVELDQQIKIAAELDGHVMRCVRDQNGNHVIQKCIECIPEVNVEFIISTFYDQVVALSTHPYGCRVIQRVLEHCHNPKTQCIMMNEILESVCKLTQDQYGNYVVQHVLAHGKPEERSAIIKKLSGQIVKMSQQKFASNVVEKCLAFGDPMERQNLVNEMLRSADDNEPLQVMMKDQFANYVVQKVLETCDDWQLELILNRIKVHLNALKKYTYGKHIVSRVEKLVTAGARRISVMGPNPVA